MTVTTASRVERQVQSSDCVEVPAKHVPGPRACNKRKSKDPVLDIALLTYETDSWPKTRNNFGMIGIS